MHKKHNGETTVKEALSRHSEPNLLALREETLEFWDEGISEKIVYALQPINPNLKISNGIRHFDWVAKYYSGAFDIYLKFGFLSQRDAYFESILSVAPPSLGDCVIETDLILEMTNSDDSMLVNVAEPVKLPQGVVPIRSRVWLKRVNHREGSGRNVSDFIPITLVGRERYLGLYRKRSHSARFICREQGKLPSQMVEAGAQCISKFSNKHSYSIGSDFLFDLDSIPRILNIVLSADEVGIFPKFLDFPLEFIEASAPPTKFHMRIGKPDAHRSNDSSAPQTLAVTA